MTVGRNRDYLANLDRRISAGLGGLSERFRERHAGYVLRTQNPDGGFPGRKGPSDLYYTDFALRCAAVLTLDDEGLWCRAAGVLQRHRSANDIVEALSAAHTRALVTARGYHLWSRKEEQEFAERIGATIARYRTVSGGYSKSVGGEASVYHTFLAALTYGLLGDSLPGAEDALAFVRSLHLPRGGFAEAPAGARQGEGGVNPTAAAIGLLAMFGALDEETAERTCRFLLSAQGDDGGFAAFAGPGPSDLLSTFTAVVTLTELGTLRRSRPGATARFVQGLARPSGGFRGAVADDGVDVEYTYYGLGTVGLLALEAGAARPSACTCSCCCQDQERTSVPTGKT